ncbi:MAG TPA: DUF983 domain-containing protein [Rhizomicrobium sp.]|nr:DUF983 domain-containing protein [Rhizomicrobium sp.]
MNSPVSAEPIDVRLAARRGAFFRCPNCGKGHLFRSYLKPVETCAHCGEQLGYIRADDGPTWLTVLIVGHVVVALALISVASTNWSTWFSVTFFSVLAVVMSLAMLPSAKGIFIGIIWSQKLAKADGS